LVIVGGVMAASPSSVSLHAYARACRPKWYVARVKSIPQTSVASIAKKNKKEIVRYSTDSGSKSKWVPQMI
jgi:hypothetical protein